MSVAQDQVRIAIVVVVEKLQPPAAEQARGLSNLTRFVDECQVLLILIEAKEFLVYIGYKQVLPTVAVIVGGVHAHPGTRTTGIAICNSRRETNLLELTLAFIEE